ncbi:MAG: hypothetical protein ACD_9C00285G0002 [uncultured bacterium]|nr:MAG: hypothetical protein ACD_9C00285G0002 [uncultured bacterium]
MKIQKKFFIIVIIVAVIIMGAVLAYIKIQPRPLVTDIELKEEILDKKDEIVNKANPKVEQEYPMHKNITTTFFWVGEEPGEANKNISNLPSAWDEKWSESFGGVDDPKNRNGYVVANFTPKENPFYFALPYNDFDDNGKRKRNAKIIIPWANSKQWEKHESMCKNQWIKIDKGDRTAYAQWEDVGPFGEDDSAYVFGTAKPKSKINDNAGLDVSPAVKDFLGLSDIDKTNWQFIDVDDVPDGPWKEIITKSNYVD